jgi:hypothetical protein
MPVLLYFYVADWLGQGLNTFFSRLENSIVCFRPSIFQQTSAIASSHFVGRDQIFLLTFNADMPILLPA